MTRHDPEEFTLRVVDHVAGRPRPGRGDRGCGQAENERECREGDRAASASVPVHDYAPAIEITCSTDPLATREAVYAWLTGAALPSIGALE